MRKTSSLMIKKNAVIQKEHRAPWECTFAKEDKSRCKSGIPRKSDQEYFEILCLCILQAGLGWGMVRKNWPKLKRGFYGFDVQKLAKAKGDELINRDGVIKHKKKVEAIMKNAKEFQNIKRQEGSFSDFLKRLKEREEKEPIRILSERFAHLGKYSAQYYLHSVGY